MRILLTSSGNIVQLNKYSIYFKEKGHDVTFLNFIFSNALSNRTIDDEFTSNEIEFYTYENFEKNVLNQKRWDVIFSPNHGASIKTSQYQNLLKIPALQQILDIAEKSSLEQSSPQEYQRLCITQKSFLEAYKKINYLTGINPSIPIQVRNLLNRNNCYCVYYPIDTDLYDSILEQETGDFVFIVSRLTPMKRVDLAIKACHYAGKKLVIASGGGLRYGLEKFVKDLGADVEFLGYIQDKKKAELMKKCKLHIFTQMWAEGPCVPSAEALYCKKPSIIFDYSSQRAIEGSYSYYIEPGNWQAMGDKIREICENYEEAKKFAIEGHAWVKNNVAPNVVAKQILDILEKIVNKRGKIYDSKIA